MPYQSKIDPNGWTQQIPDTSFVEEEKECETFYMHIPQCCQEGWDTCPHVVNRDVYKDKKKNIGL